jgi:hypothetical protein
VREEKLRVLRLVAEGKVSPEEGLELLESIGEPAGEPGGTEPRKKKFIVVRITSADGDTVNLRVPVSALDLAETLLAAYAPGIKERPEIAEKISHLGKLKDAIADMEGTIVDIASEDGDTVKIYVETEG